MLARYAVYAAILDRYLAFGHQLIDGLTLLEIALKTVVKSGNFIPTTHVAVEVER